MTSSTIRNTGYFGIDLTSDGFDSGDEFEVFGSYGGTVDVGSSRKIQYSTLPFKSSISDTFGTLDDSTVSFDGVTCKDGQKAKYFAGRLDNAHIDVETFPATSGLTVEFWTKSTDPY